MSAAAFSDEDLARLWQALPANVELQHVASVDSTNSAALRDADDCEAARLIVTDEQTAGRGRGENQWWSAPGSLTFSLLLNTDHFKLDERRWPLASLATGLAVCEALGSVAPGADLAVKWPNDVFWSGRKVSGVLVETTGSNGRRMVIGVGVNVNNSLVEAPVELRDRATSACDESRRQLDRVSVLSQIVLAVHARIRQVSDDPQPVLRQLRTHCFLSGRAVVVETAGGAVAGTCCGIGDDGELLVEDAGGELHRLLAGVVVEFD